MIDKNNFTVLNIVKKEDFSGSIQGMRYRLHKKEKEGTEELCIEATVWPQPFSYDKTEESQKERREFPFNEEGRVQIADWLNQKYEEEKPRWSAALVWKLDEKQ